MSHQKISIDASNGIIDAQESNLEAEGEMLDGDDIEDLESDIEEVGGSKNKTHQMLLDKLEGIDINLMSEEDLDRYIRSIKEELKVGLIIDGQHRVSGTRGKNIPFIVAALPDAEWQELAFQFIVLNSTAKAVKEALLINIIGNSLSSEELTKVESRLVESGIPVPLYQGVMKLHDDPDSPFYGMLRFGMKEKAPIEAKAAKAKIANFWHKCKEIYPIVQHLIPGENRREKLENWVNSGMWYDYLRIFWGSGKKRYEDSSELWKSDMLPDNSAPVSKLLRSTILNLVQTAICQVMVEAINTEVNNDPDGEKTISKLVPDIASFQKRCDLFFRKLSPEFFTEWGPASKGLDGSRGPRDQFIKAVKELVSSQKTLAQLKNQTSGNIIFKLVP
jgi:hypothetical protein